jgi:ABC-type bacteriocin/lantibiotic exporter with double-glycine peptidase domain
MQLAGVLVGLVRQIANMENSMNFVDRITYYSTQVEQEKARKSKDPPSDSWPSQGQIVVKDLRMRYRPDTPLVLKGSHIHR